MSGSRRDRPRDQDRRGKQRTGGPSRSSGGDRRAGGRDGRSRDAGRGRDGQGRPDPRRSGKRDASAERERPRPPIKGRRRTFDEDSAPNPRERARSSEDGPDDRSGGQWVDEGPVRKAAGDAVRRGGSGRGRATSGNGRNDKRRRERTTKRVEGALELDRARLDRTLGASRAKRTIERLGEATDAFAQDRLEEARKLLKPLVELVPDEPSIRELYGLTLYRLERWRSAITELEEFERRSGSYDQHPVIADCHRALGHHAKVAELWEELGAASPSAAIVAEGRIVYAGSLADRGQLAAAIDVLEDGALGSKKLKEHHLRMRYALGDLYDRAGEHQAARHQFEAVARSAPDFFDVQERLAQL